MSECENCDFCTCNSNVNVVDGSRKPKHPRDILICLYWEVLCTISGLIDGDVEMLNKLIHENGDIDTVVANRLSSLLNTTPEVWINLQKKYDKWMKENCNDNI